MWKVVLSVCVVASVCAEEGVVPLPDVDVPFDPNHKLLFRNSSTGEVQSLGHALDKMGGRKDFYYAMLGAVEDHSHTMLHFTSFNSLSRMLDKSLDGGVKASCINTDFREPSQDHQDSFDYFGSELHDFGDDMGVSFNRPEDQITTEFDFLGVTLYSWNDCIESSRTNLRRCVHITQIRNSGELYPKHIAVEHLGPVFDWIEDDMRRQNYGTPLVLLFQNFNTGLPKITSNLQEIINSFGRPVNLLGVGFAMMDRNVTLNRNLCQTVGRFEKTEAGTSPVLVFGSLPPYSYFMLQFSPYSRGLKGLYVVDVGDQHQTLLTKIDTHKLQCI